MKELSGLIKPAWLAYMLRENCWFATRMWSGWNGWELLNQCWCWRSVLYLPFFSSLLFDNQLRQFFFSSLLLSKYFLAAAPQHRICSRFERTARTRETLTPEEEVSSHIDIKKWAKISWLLSFFHLLFFLLRYDEIKQLPSQLITWKLNLEGTL